MKLRVDVGDVHAVLALVCGAIALLGCISCLVSEWRDDLLITSLIGFLLAAFWTSLFALVLRGTIVTRLMAGAGLIAAILAVCTGMIAVTVN